MATRPSVDTNLSTQDICRALDAHTDALRALVTALGWQIDPVRLHTDLQTMASLTRKNGCGLGRTHR